MQNLGALCHDVWVYVGRSQNVWRTCALNSMGWIDIDLKNMTLPQMCQILSF